MVYIIISLYGLISHSIFNKSLDAIYYVDILSTVIIPYLKMNGHNLLLQQNNSLVHSARSVQSFRRQTSSIDKVASQKSTYEYY